MGKSSENEPFLNELADTMVEENVSCRDAAAMLNLPLTSEEIGNIERRKSFKQLLYDRRHQYWLQIGANPLASKEALVGQIKQLADKMAADGDYDKATEALFKLAKVAGWVGAETNVNVFGSLSAKEFAQLREKVEKQLQKSAIVN